MHDPVGDVLRQRSALGRGAGAGIAVSLMLHGGIAALAIYAALHAEAPRAASVLSISLAPVAEKPAAAATQKPKPVAPRIEPPKPEPTKPTTKPPEKNTVPLSPFGRSTQKGSENPETKKPPVTSTTPPATTSTAAAPEIPVGGSGITGLEGGDFPYTLYLQGMQRKISGNWYRPEGTRDLICVIYFRIQRDGAITDVKPEVSSGNTTFDRQARSAVQSSSPLNPLPFGYNGTYLGVRLTFR